MSNTAENGSPNTSGGAATVGPAIARVLLGLIFLVFGLNLLFMFLPKPPIPLPAAALAFLGALAATGYMIRLLAAVQVLVALMLLANRAVPLALTVIAPVIVNIIAYHSFLQPAGIAPGAVAAALEIYLAWVYRGSFVTVLAWRAAPTRQKTS